MTPPDAHPPLRSLSFTLTRADARAYAGLPGEIRGWRRVAFFVWIGLGGAVVAALPEEWVGAEGGWRFWGWMAAAGLVQYGLASLAMTWASHRRAARRVPAPRAAELRDHAAFLEWIEDGRVATVAPETVWPVIATGRHVFAVAGPLVMIVPLRAFADAPDMDAFAQDLRRRAEAGDP